MADVVKVTDLGLGLVTAALVASDAKYVQWGEDAEDAAAVTDTVLETPQENRVVGTQTQQEEDEANDTYQVVAEITAGASRGIKEVGIFDAAGDGSPPTGGVLFLRGTFDEINLSEDDKINFAIRVTVSDGSA